MEGYYYKPMYDLSEYVETDYDPSYQQGMSLYEPTKGLSKEYLLNNTLGKKIMPYEGEKQILMPTRHTAIPTPKPIKMKKKQKGKGIDMSGKGKKMKIEDEAQIPADMVIPLLKSKKPIPPAEKLKQKMLRSHKGKGYKGKGKSEEMLKRIFGKKIPLRKKLCKKGKGCGCHKCKLKHLIKRIK